MNKKIVITLALIIAFSFTGISHTNASTDSNILPNNPFYFFKDLGRNIQDFLTFNPAQKVELRLQVAEEKLSEIEKIAETNPNSLKYEEYLKGYIKAVERVKEKISTINEEKKETVLDNITSTMIKQEVRLEDLKNAIRTDNGEMIQKVKNNIVKEYTATSLQVGNEDSIKNKIENIVSNMDREQVGRIEEEAPENLKNILKNINIVQRIKEENTAANNISNSDLINRVNEEAKKIGLTPAEILSEVGTFSAEDKATLERYALDVLAGNKTKEEIVQDFDKINLSEDAVRKLNNLREISEQRTSAVSNQGTPTTSNQITSMEAKNYCLNQGNKILEESGKIICISPNNEKCEINEYLKKECLFK